MQPPFPTKKFFLVLLFLILVAGVTLKIFGFLSNRAAPSTPEEQNIAVVQNEFLHAQNHVITPAEEQRVATSTLNAVAAVVYLNEQTKANGATMGEITASIGKKIQDAKDKLDGNAYAKSDILTGSDNSPEAIKKYGNDMAGIFLTEGKETQSSSYLEIIKKALETKDPKEMSKLDPYINFQKNVIKDALALRVPSSASSVHLDIINASAEMLGLFQGFQSAFDDTPSAMASNSRLTKAAHRFADSFKEADAFFKQSGVIFLPEEAGSIFARASQSKN